MLAEGLRNRAGRVSPIKYQGHTGVEDKNRIMTMHEILNGRKGNRPSHTPVKINPEARQITPQKRREVVQTVKTQKKTVQIPQMQFQGKTIMTPQLRYEQEAMVYCPVCERNYPNSRTKEHVQKHLQPDPVLIRTSPMTPVVTEVVALPQPIPQAQTMMIVEPAEYVINDFFGGNNFYIIDNTQGLPVPPEILVNEEIIEQTVHPYMPPPSIHSSVRGSQQAVFQQYPQQYFPQPTEVIVPNASSSISSHPASFPSLNYPHPGSMGSMPLQTIQEQIITPHSRLTQSRHSQMNNIPITTVPFINSISDPYQSTHSIHQSVHQSIHPIPNAMSIHDPSITPTYPVHYPMKKATTFNLFSCFDTIGHDSFEAGGIINQNDFYARARR